MHSLQSFIRLFVITSCLFIVGASCTQADDAKKSPTTSSPGMTTMMNPMMMGQMNGMMDPHMYMKMMGHMTGMMNPQMMNSMMNPMMGMMNPMMMGGGMMNPMMGMNMMYPMMGMMGPMMSPMSGGMGMSGMGATNNGSNPMAQMPGGHGQMMDPKQYEQWFNQYTEMMKNMTPQAPAQNNQ